jgi:hypothetical protein
VYSVFVVIIFVDMVQELNNNGSIYPTRDIFRKQIHDLRDIFVSL